MSLEHAVDIEKLTLTLAETSPEELIAFWADT